MGWTPHRAIKAKCFYRLRAQQLNRQQDLRASWLQLCGLALVLTSCNVGQQSDNSRCASEADCTTEVERRGGSFPSAGNPSSGNDGLGDRAPPENAIDNFVPPSGLVRRLTAEEYVHTVEDLFSIQLSPAERSLLPEDRPLEGFVSIATSQTASLDHVRAYNALAAAISERLDWTSFLESHGVCGLQTANCENQFVNRIGTTLFRRPLGQETQEVYLSLFSQAREAGANFEQSGRAVLQAFLQGPHFIYRVERENEGTGQTRPLDGYELASRLSYALWGNHT